MVTVDTPLTTEQLDDYYEEAGSGMLERDEILSLIAAARRELEWSTLGESPEWVRALIYQQVEFAEQRLTAFKGVRALLQDTEDERDQLRAEVERLKIHARESEARPCECCAENGCDCLDDTP